MNTVLKEIGIRVISGVLIFLIVVGLFEWWNRMNPKKPCDCKNKNNPAPGEQEIPMNDFPQMETPTGMNYSMGGLAGMSM